MLTTEAMRFHRNRKNSSSETALKIKLFFVFSLLKSLRVKNCVAVETNKFAFLDPVLKERGLNSMFGLFF